MYINKKYWLYPGNESTHYHRSIKFDVKFFEKPFKIVTKSCKEKLYQILKFSTTKIGQLHSQEY